MRRDGKAIEGEQRSDLFVYYCRLFSIAALSPFSGLAVRLVNRFAVFRRRPGLINMAALEFGFRVVNALHRRAVRLRDHWKPRTPALADVQAKAVSQDLFQIP